MDKTLPTDLNPGEPGESLVCVSHEKHDAADDEELLVIDHALVRSQLSSLSAFRLGNAIPGRGRLWPKGKWHFVVILVAGLAEKPSHV
jgi:hypothetical protein